MSADINENDVGRYFQNRDDGSIWKCISFCRQPTATMERVDPKDPGKTPGTDRIGGAVGCRNLEPFVRLIKEE